MLRTKEIAPGAKVIHQIMDSFHPGTIVEVEGAGYDNRGRGPGLVVSVVLLRTDLAGNSFLAQDRILTQWLDPRTTKVDALDDEPLEELWAKAGQTRSEFLAARAQNRVTALPI